MSLSNAFPVALAAFALFAACNSVQPGRADANAPAGQEMEPVELGETSMGDDIVVGGYGPGDASEPGAKLAYQMVEEAIYERYPTRALVDVVTLETQLVAGLNYRFRVEMTGAPDSRAIFSAVVYRDLSDTYELTSLEKLQ